MVFIFFTPLNVSAQVLTCGLKKVTIKDGRINKIEHEDGTVHTGVSVSDNWEYDGTSIKHSLLGESIPCGNEPKTRDEIISELSSKFLDHPDSYGMNKEEAELMKKYTSNLMKTDNSCHLLVDAAKSVSKQGMFYIDCNDKNLNLKRHWVSEDDLKEGVNKMAMTPVSEGVAINICDNEIKKRIKKPTEYNPSLVIGTTSRIVDHTGRNVVEIDFKASNNIGREGKYIGKCILEEGIPIEVTISEK